MRDERVRRRTGSALLDVMLSLALLATAAALAESAPSYVGTSFMDTRLRGRIGATFGTAALDRVTIQSLLERALPA